MITACKSHAGMNLSTPGVVLTTKIRNSNSELSETVDKGNSTIACTAITHRPARRRQARQIGKRTSSMSLIQTCKCEECDMQKSFANHWVMLYEKNGNLVILPKWDVKMMRRTRHFCGRAHASRYVERWIAGLTLNVVSDAVLDTGPQKPQQIISDEEDEATALELAVRYR